MRDQRQAAITAAAKAMTEFEGMSRAENLNLGLSFEALAKVAIDAAFPLLVRPIQEADWRSFSGDTSELG